MSEQISKTKTTETATQQYIRDTQKRVVSITKNQYERLTQKPFAVVLNVGVSETTRLLNKVGESLKSLSWDGEKVRANLFNSDVLRIVAEITQINFSVVIEQHKTNYGFLAVVNSDLRDNIKRLEFETLYKYL